MTIDFVRIVSTMRLAQKSYFRNRSKDNLLEAIRREIDVDKALEQLLPDDLMQAGILQPGSEKATQRHSGK